MTANPDIFGSQAFELETDTDAGWAESTDTFTNRVRTIGPPSIPSNLQERLDVGITRQYPHEEKMGVRGPWGGGFSVTMPFTGYGASTASGALSLTDQGTLLANALGASSVAGVGTTVDTSPTSASQFALVGGTVASGDLIRVGAAQDGRGNGQFTVVNNASTITTFAALDATPNAGDIVYSAQQVYINEDEASFADIRSSRWLLQTANGQWKARGCFPTGISLSSYGIGEVPQLSIDYQGSRWGEANETFPDATAIGHDVDEPLVAAGSLFIQDVGTTTRQLFDYRSANLSIGMNVSALRGPGGKDAYQAIVGARRNPFALEFSVTVDAEAAGTTTLNDIFKNGTFQHILWTWSSEPGKSIGVYMPNAKPVMYATQEASDGLNRVSMTFRPCTYTAGTTTLLRSPLRFGFA